MAENIYARNLAKRIKQMLPGAIIVKNDPREIQGIPDLLVLYGKHWAALEAKDHAMSSHRPNQDYYVELMGRMSFAAFIYPENEEGVMYELQRSFGIVRPSRLPQSV